MMNFTYDAYQELVTLLRENSYTVCDYFDWKNYEKPVILRHDIDNDIGKALKLAELEHRMGVKSTYYVLLSSDFYNVFSKKNLGRLKMIQKLGHSIGLHFDEVRYGEEVNVLDAVDREVHMLEKVLNCEVGSVSMHRPSRKTLEADYQFRQGTVVNSYGKVFFEEFKYVSDSRRHWREDVKQIIQSGDFKKLHILTHPIWYSEKEKVAKEVLKEFCRQKVSACYESLIDDITNLHEILTMEELKI